MIPKTITITHLGAKTCVTGYCHLVQARHDHGASIAILVDCSIRMDKLFIIRPQMLVRLHIEPHGKQGELGRRDKR